MQIQKIIFANLDTYLDMYHYIAQKPRAKNEVVDYLTESAGKKKKTASEQVGRVEAGNITFLSIQDDLITFDTELFVNTMK